jgi:hypothetical protein
MKRVADWLKQLGMSQYAKRFADNDIDFSILWELTDQDLEKIGVASLGHRRKILRAIIELGGPEAATAVSPVPPLKPAQMLPSMPAPAAGERRYLTVMFCDLVGSTAISSQLDAEEWRDLVGAYLDASSAAVAEVGGHVAKKLGDGLMVLVRLPGGARERRRARGVVNPARLGRTQPQERRNWRAPARWPHRPWVRASCR